uniref:Uncharacterized protein n=1 Tax=Anguilla anguilla TaxID=7936 RepID=A0A0E9TNW2_ANGAN
MFHSVMHYGIVQFSRIQPLRMFRFLVSCESRIESYWL